MLSIQLVEYAGEGRAKRRMAVAMIF